MMFPKDVIWITETTLYLGSFTGKYSRVRAFYSPCELSSCPIPRALAHRWTTCYFPRGKARDTRIAPWKSSNVHKIVSLFMSFCIM